VAFTVAWCLAGALSWPARAFGVCLPAPACLEATFPPDYAWGQLNPGAAGNESPDQVITVTSNAPWGVTIASDLADGRMKEWNGSAYVATGAKVLSQPLGWSLSRIGAAAQPLSFRALSSTPATVVSDRPTTCTLTCDSAQIAVRYRQAVSFADAPAGTNDYRIEVTYVAAQGF
jgi:hypothetical protein